MRHDTRNISALSFLVYFLFYVVSPVSAATATAHEFADGADRECARNAATSPLSGVTLPPEEFHEVLENREGGSNLFICDMVLWEILKKAKPSDHADNAVKAVNELCYISKKHNGAGSIDCINDGLISRAAAFSWIRRDDSTDMFICFPCACLEFSGLSPPLVS
jgi:hypothetical protein